MYMSAEQQAGCYHHAAAQNKLVSAQNHGVFVFGVTLYQNRGNSIRDGSKHYKAVAVKIHVEVKSIEINYYDSGKSKYTGDDFSWGERLLLEYKAGNDYNEENISAADNSSFNSGRVGKPDIEEKILYYRLKAAYFSHQMKIFLFWKEKFLSAGAVKQNGEYSRKGKAYSGKKNGGGNSLVRHYKLIAHLDKGGGTAPERTAEKSCRSNKPRICKKLFVGIFHFKTP